MFVAEKLERPKALLFGVTGLVFVGVSIYSRINGLYGEENSGIFRLLLFGRQGRPKLFWNSHRFFSCGEVPKKARSQNRGMETLQNWGLLARGQ
jgi:hypothetical protein